ncbi:alpha/beta hydrolase [Steroidobacter cummioxidans]|uniref:alpha/beta hydrolase n=1 Tax=Steroidobacter cummioxidans TaxID=1803913 RepID=UPI000E31B7F9|nr:alpha/beta hydrolase-fold protein [Steroidobacter cummioxidans]
MQKNNNEPALCEEWPLASALQDDHEFFPSVESHLIRSRHVAQTFKVQVMLPGQKRSETARFPVIYATDGNMTFDMLKGISHILQMSARDAPRFILVGIGYPSDCPRAGALLRGRDLTFPGYPKLNREPPPIAGVLLPRQGTKDFCGAEDFQNFIEHELIPLIDRRYPTQAGERTYFGHSAGGGFGLYTLFKRSSLFNNYIVSSPGLMYDGESSGGVSYQNYEFALELVRRCIESGPALRRARLYMSVGSEEEYEPELKNWRLTSSFHRVTSVLKAAALADLEVTTEVLAGETHVTAWPISFIHGIKALFGSRPQG